MRFAFEDQGMRVLEACDAAAALSTFSREPVELVLQDLCLPDLDGFDLVRKLRALPGGPEVPILAFSGMLTAHDEARVSAAGFDDLIAKPIEPSRLVQIVRGHLPEGDDVRLAAFGAGRLIIVADDDAVQRKLAASKLEALGFNVMLAHDGAEVLALARRTPPAAVLSDVLMPGIDGFALCAEMRRDAALTHIPLVLTTNSYVEPAEKDLALKAGAHGLVHRTPDLKAALEVLHQALSQPFSTDGPTISAAELEVAHKQRMMRQLERQVTINARINQRCALLSAERMSRDRAALLRSILESIGDGVAVADRHGNFIQWNAAASELVKLGPWNSSFQTVGEGYGLYGADKATPLRADQLPLVRAINGESVDGEEMFVRHDGALAGRWFSASSRPWRDEEGRARGGVAVFRDVTNDKKTQSQLMVSDRMASVGVLAAGVAHEINNPLAALIVNLDMCKAELASGNVGAVAEMMGDAVEAAERVRVIVRDVKMFSRQDDAERGAADIGRVLDSSLRMAFNEIRHRA